MSKIYSLSQHPLRKGISPVILLRYERLSSLLTDFTHYTEKLNSMITQGTGEKGDPRPSTDGPTTSLSSNILRTTHFHQSQLR